ncbi:hydrogenase nickel incorporation protein HypB [Helicobacter heilmannii]|uniref:[NiFe] hydrogenase nickel incorporation-associated protein HypB n=1 Tax=Helicobacter heilmannii TaxID=35817 RepID=A0A0K2Y4Y0_HELHE|nr:hydrogenase nickel incorporation protein HypB [Helicobacter heilmannii]BDQ27236.1 hydrogenase/urease nickel incorporation protein HypB [Helicobacter heilmannii]CCM12180.1 [NiFe] hydrogenase nickel incorporation-associated protein HypB [Helicobacter heilmannii ASB1.4]CRI34191.1 [NiFe] hydrogenase nickel incorporation-associated protein HypB [Helicobacter heilmannii]
MIEATAREQSLNNNPNLSKKDVKVVEKILSKNDLKALEMKERYMADGLYVLNFMSSPGSGKTTLLENLASFEDFKFCVIEGDLQTNRDADRLIKKNVAAQQITTGEACHLEAAMLEGAYDILKDKGAITASDYLVIENVGNLVCPSSYNLGAAMNIVLLSTPEGDDKVLKYPSMFLCADAVVVSKADLMDVFGFRISQVQEDMDKLKPNTPIFTLSSKDRASLEAFKDFIVSRRAENYQSTHAF